MSEVKKVGQPPKKHHGTGVYKAPKSANIPSGTSHISSMKRLVLMDYGMDVSNGIEDGNEKEYEGGRVTQSHRKSDKESSVSY